jgi:general secretion pathway protein E/type IV pilus assembly protein PilB
MVSQDIEEISSDENRLNIEDIREKAEEASVLKLVNQIIVEAYHKRATDIHIEPYRGKIRLRYRIDGVLFDQHVPENLSRFLPAIISRIKIMGNLNIVERRIPQDGRALVRVEDQTLDLRVSILPTPHGESVVVRILPTKMFFNLEKLGLFKDELAVFEDLLRKPNGIIFVTGPTGSGKTTTLYACLQHINRILLNMR